MKKNCLILSFCFIICQLATAQSYSGAESVEFDYNNNRYLIANSSSNQILSRASNGTLTVFSSLTGSPYGIEIVGDTLYCCTSGSLRAINLNTGVQIFNQTIATGAFLNGITHDPNGNLYITGFSSKKIYRFNTATRQFNVFVNQTTTTPNGIIYDPYDGINPRLILAGWENTNATIKSISLADSTISLLVATPFGNIDGIAKGKNGNFYISCWSNQTIQRYDSTFTNTPTAMVTSGLSNPADIFYNHLTDTLAVPIGSNVNFYFFGDLTNNKSLKSEDISIFPNPSNGIVTFNVPNASFKNVNLKLYEIGTGKEVFSQNISNLQNNMAINIKNSQISEGFYLLELFTNNTLISRQKLILE